MMGYRWLVILMFKIAVTANLVLSMTTRGDKSENESGSSLEKVQNGNVLPASFWRSGND